MRHRLLYGCLTVLTVLLIGPTGRAQVAPEAPPANIRSENGAYYTIYAENMPGADWTEKIQRALDAAATRSGTAEVVLPPGETPISRTIEWSGMPVKLPDEPKIVYARFTHRVSSRCHVSKWSAPACIAGTGDGGVFERGNR